MCSDCSSFSFDKYMCEVDLLLRKGRQLVEVMVYESTLRRLSPLTTQSFIFSANHCIYKQEQPSCSLDIQISLWGLLRHLTCISYQGWQGIAFMEVRKHGRLSEWVKSLSRVRLCNPVDCSLPGFSIHGILQARILKWVTISFSRGSSRPRDGPRVSCIGSRCFNFWTTREAGFQTDRHGQCLEGGSFRNRNISWVNLSFTHTHLCLALFSEQGNELNVCFYNYSIFFSTVTDLQYH